MPSRLRTPRSDLDRLPQFEPDHTFRLDETQHESGLPFPESRARQIRDVLSAAMKDHVRKARFQGKSTSLERFLGNAMLAIATYESRSLRRRAYDRGRASKLLKEVRVALWAFQRALERTVEWKQLDRYLESLFVADRKQNERQQWHTRQTGDPTRRLKRRVRALLEARKRADRYRAEFRSRSPRGILNQLEHLEALLTLALEKLEFQPGDVQRDEIAREFARRHGVRLDVRYRRRSDYFEIQTVAFPAAAGDGQSRHSQTRNQAPNRLSVSCGFCRG